MNIEVEELKQVTSEHVEKSPVTLEQTQSNGYTFSPDGTIVAAPQAEQPKEEVPQTVTLEQTQSNGYTFGPDGTIVAAPQAEQPAPENTQPVSTIKFDENGTVVSA